MFLNKQQLNILIFVTRRKPVTQRALQLVFKQAQEAKLSNERVFQIIVVRGWESFKAAWNWQETNAELEQLENPVVEQQETAPRNAPVLLRKEYKGLNNGLLTFSPYRARCISFFVISC